MSRVEASVWIDVPPDRAWEYVQDHDRRREWDTRISGAENMTGLPVSAGSRVRYLFRGAGGAACSIVSS